MWFTKCGRGVLFSKLGLLKLPVFAPILSLFEKWMENRNIRQTIRF
jgi:hypothetical protein